LSRDAQHQAGRTLRKRKNDRTEIELQAAKIITAIAASTRFRRDSCPIPMSFNAANPPAQIAIMTAVAAVSAACLLDPEKRLSNNCAANKTPKTNRKFAMSGHTIYHKIAAESVMNDQKKTIPSLERNRHPSGCSHTPRHTRSAHQSMANPKMHAFCVKPMVTQLPSRRVGINSAFDLRNAFLMPENQHDDRDHTTDNHCHNRNQKRP